MYSNANGMGVYISPMGMVPAAPGPSVQHHASIPIDPNTVVSGGYYPAQGCMGNAVTRRSNTGAYPSVAGMTSTLVGGDPYNAIVRRDSFAATTAAGPVGSVVPAPLTSASVTAGNGGGGPIIWQVGNTVANSNEAYTGTENVDSYHDGNDRKSWG